MKDLTYNRPYQYVEDLRLFACYRSKDHAVFVGQGFADNAVAFVETGSMLTRLEQQGKVVHGDFDQLVTQSFDVNMPFRIYVVNPDDENGKASNAIEYTSSPDIPILDVKVDGKSVVKDQIAYIDLTGKLDVIMKPNKVYGTDSDGKETQFDRSQIEGVQHFFLNGDEIPVDMGNVRIIDIAKESKTVQRVDTPLQLYGTNQEGADATYPKDSFATAESVVNATKDIDDLKRNKQDRDKNAKDGYIAIMSNGQSIGSNRVFQDTMDKIDKSSEDLNDLISRVNKGLDKDWKATAVEKSIINHPVSQSSIVISDLPLEQENKFRNVTNGILYGRQPDTLLQNGVAVGSGNSAFENASAFGNQAKSIGKNSTSVGAMTESDGENSVSLGAFSNAKSDKSIAIGPTSSATGSNSVALGSDSIADVDNTVSVGFDTTDSNLKSAYRRITAVDTPINDHDAATKAYVDKKAASNGGAPATILNSVSPIFNKRLAPAMGNVDGWRYSTTGKSGTWKKAEIASSKDVVTQISTPDDVPIMSDDTGFLRISDKEGWFIAKPFLPAMYSKYYFSCYVTLVQEYPTSATPTIEIGCGMLRGDGIATSVNGFNPVITGSDFKSRTQWLKISGVIPINTPDVEIVVPMIHVVNPAGDGTEFTEVYITNINIERMSLGTPFPSNDVWALSYIPRPKVLRINNLVYFSINGEIKTGPGLPQTANLCDEKINGVPLSINLRPGKGTGGVVINCISLNYAIAASNPIYIRIDEDGNMYATGTVKNYYKIYGSAVYPVDDFSGTMIQPVFPRSSTDPNSQSGSGSGTAAQSAKSIPSDAGESATQNDDGQKTGENQPNTAADDSSSKTDESKPDDSKTGGIDSAQPSSDNAESAEKQTTDAKDNGNAK